MQIIRHSQAFLCNYHESHVLYGISYHSACFRVNHSTKQPHEQHRKPMHNPLCTSYCYSINIGSDIDPPAVLYQYHVGKITISMADVVADPVIGTPLNIMCYILMRSLPVIVLEV